MVNVHTLLLECLDHILGLALCSILKWCELVLDDFTADLLHLSMTLIGEIVDCIMIDIATISLLVLSQFNQVLELLNPLARVQVLELVALFRVELGHHLADLVLLLCDHVWSIQTNSSITADHQVRIGTLLELGQLVPDSSQSIGSSRLAWLVVILVFTGALFAILART